MVKLDKELILHIKKLQKRAALTFVAILLFFISILFAVAFLFESLFIAIDFFAIALICVVFLLYSSNIGKKELREAKYTPVILKADSNLRFEEIVSVFEKLTNEENKLSTSDEVLFFRLNKIFELTAILYRTVDFDKKNFDSAKDRINKKVNKVLNISHWVTRSNTRKMMRFNIIHTDTLNDELYRLLSLNASHNLTRVEGIINMAIVGNQIIIPPIYGNCDLNEIGRYKGTVKFISQILLNK